MAAERETADRLIAHFLADRVGATFDGHISGVTRSGLFVELDETGADGFVPARTVGGDEYFRFDEPGRAFVGRSARSTGSAIRSPCSWSRRRRSPARCGSRFCRKAAPPAVPDRLNTCRGPSATRSGATPPRARHQR